MTNEIYPCLWFNDNARAAADFYTGMFADANIITDNGMVVRFNLAGQKFMGLNGGPVFTINPSISFFVTSDDEEEITSLWQKLTEGGSILMPLNAYEWSPKYGWVKDRFGVSWQLNMGSKEDVSQKISPVLMFTKQYCGKAEEAVEFYKNIFPGSGVSGILKYAKEDADSEELVKHAQFNLSGYTIIAMDSSAAHAFEFNEAISFVITCSTQQEIDYYWSKLTEGGIESQCGWLKDKFGVSWQVVPAILGSLMSNPATSQKVVKAFMQMKKFDIAALLYAAEA